MDLHVPAWGWIALAAGLSTMIVIDVIAHRGEHVDSHRRAVVWSCVWIAAAVAFGVFVGLQFGRIAAEQYFAAYLLEKSLSVDNLFLFLLVFGALGIPQTEQRRVLTWGILGALVTRALFIAGGTALVHRWHEVTYVFGGLLVITAVKLFASHDPSESRVLAWLERHLPWTTELHGHRFFTRVDGRLVATPLLLALVAIEASDVVFALDSIPAAFAVTRDTFLIYSSNVFAVLGLRSLYIVLAQALQRLRYLRYGLATVIAFAGAKMLLASWVHVPSLVSVAVIAGVLAITIVASLAVDRRRDVATEVHA